VRQYINRHDALRAHLVRQLLEDALERLEEDIIVGSTLKNSLQSR
jgi:hypothetical protein